MIFQLSKTLTTVRDCYVEGGTETMKPNFMVHRIESCAEIKNKKEHSSTIIQIGKNTIAYF